MSEQENEDTGWEAPSDAEMVTRDLDALAELSSSLTEREFFAEPENRRVRVAVAMRMQGHTIDDITQVLGFASMRECSNAIHRAIRSELRADPTSRDRMRDLANTRLERLLRGVWNKAVNPEHPEHLVAVTKAKELIDRHIKLYGLDAPSEVVVHNPSDLELEQWVMSMMARETGSVQEYDVLEGEVVSDTGVSPEKRGDDDDDGGAGVPARVGA